MAKIEAQANTTLGELAEGISEGIVTGKNRVFLLSVDVADKLGCTQHSLNELIQNLFDDSNENYSSDFSLDDCVIQIHSDTEKEHSYICFYCKTSYNPLNGQCPNCLEDIVRCKLCNKPIGYTDNYTTCASCGIIGKPNDVTGFVNVDHICESCMFTKKYNVV